MRVFIELHLTTQFGPVILVILCHSHVYVCVCACVCVRVFIKLHTTAQSDPVIYLFYATVCNPPGGYFSWTYCWLETRVYPSMTPHSLYFSLSLSLSLCLFIKVAIPFILYPYKYVGYG